MALNMVTDSPFDDALTWLSGQEKKSRSEIIRELVFEKYQNMHKTSFQFGALAAIVKGKPPQTEEILKELREMKIDHDLD